MNPYIKFINQNKIHIIYIIGILYVLFFNPLDDNQKRKDEELINRLKNRNIILIEKMDSLNKQNVLKNIELKLQIISLSNEVKRINKDNSKLKDDILNLNNKKDYIIYEKPSISNVDSAVNIINKLYE